MIIDLNTLDTKLLSKIPLSIRLNSKDNLIDTDNLPLEVLYELRNIKEQKPITTYVDDSTFDLRPDFSIYNDFASINTKKDAIIEYVKNYLIVDKGDYPFDPSFGTSIKKYLQLLDGDPAQISINQELLNLSNILKNSFEIPVTIANMGLRKIDNQVSSYYELNVMVKVDDSATSIKFEKNIETYYLM